MTVNTTEVVLTGIEEVDGHLTDGEKRIANEIIQQMQQAMMTVLIKPGDLAGLEDYTEINKEFLRIRYGKDNLTITEK